MKISARNQLKGTVVDVVKGATTSHVRTLFIPLAPPTPGDADVGDP